LTTPAPGWRAGPGRDKLRRVNPIALVIDGRARDLGGIGVWRVLPATERRLVGPFIFFDHFGPGAFPPGGGIDVRPHPHINLATVTYLYEGELLHRDSLGSTQEIRPGDVNWMTAGRGIVHSERTGPVARATGGRSHGLQLWVALPTADEETEPAFHHHPAATLPRLSVPGLDLRLIAGNAFGLTSPVRTFSTLFYADAAASDGASFALPDDHQDRAVYVTSGRLRCGDQLLEPGKMVLFAPGVSVTLRAEGPARAALLGGAPLDGHRHIWWNFVSSRPERIEQAKRDWKEGRFGVVPGDDQEFIPLPDG
jgi:redox-sensitive bicupin YhaK (pirin superfamily)